MKQQIRAAFAAVEVIAITGMLAACGGGGGSAPPPPPPPPPVAQSIKGVAAAGAPLTDAVVVLIDANGARRVAQVSTDGSYKFDDVGALTPPFLLQAMGSVGGQVVVLHAPALVGDIGSGVVNITPLTEMLTAAVLGGTPGTLIDQNSADFSRITPAAVTSSAGNVQALVKPLLDAVVPGATIDVRTTPMNADHEGLDRALDGLQVTLTDAGYAVGTTVGGSTTHFNANTPGTATPISFDGSKAVLLSAASAELLALDQRLAALTAQFAAGIPTADSLQPFFSADFQDDGMDRAAFIAELRRIDGESGFNLAGASFDKLRVLQVADADNIVVGYRVNPAASQHVRPWEQRSRLQRVGGTWIFRGNGDLAAASVNLMSRIVFTTKTEAEIAAMSDVTKLNGAYRRPAFDANGNIVDTLWLGYPTDRTFGLHGWTSRDQFSGDKGKFRSQYNQYYGASSSRVRQYLMLTVPTRHASPLIAEVQVTGPGLPASGLTLVPPPANLPRASWVFKGDSFIWNAFDSDRCAQLTTVPDCALDISKIDAGAEYVFSLRDATAQEIGVQRARLAVKPRTPEQLFARRDELFPQFQLDAARQFSLRNLYDDTGSFVGGKQLTLPWKLPTAAKSTLSGIGFTVLYPDQGVDRTISRWKALFGNAAATSATFTVPVTTPLYGAWSTLIGFDHFGNEYQHEVSPDNPY